MWKIVFYSIVSERYQEDIYKQIKQIQSTSFPQTFPMVAVNLILDARHLLHRSKGILVAPFNLPTLLNRCNKRRRQVTNVIFCFYACILCW